MFLIVLHFRRKENTTDLFLFIIYSWKTWLNKINMARTYSLRWWDNRAQFGTDITGVWCQGVSLFCTTLCSFFHGV